MRTLNTIVQYQKIEQKKLAQKKVENFQLSRRTFQAENLIVNRNLFNINNLFQLDFPQQDAT